MSRTLVSSKLSNEEGNVKELKDEAAEGVGAVGRKTRVKNCRRTEEETARQEARVQYYI